MTEFFESGVFSPHQSFFQEGVREDRYHEHTPKPRDLGNGKMWEKLSEIDR